MKLTSAIVLTFAASAAGQESFSIDRSTISGGGGLNLPAGGSPEFSVSTSIGPFDPAPAAGPPSEFSVAGGYWNFDPAIIDANLRIDLAGGTVHLAWDAVAIPVILESSADLSLWEAVQPQPSTPSYSGPSSRIMFYRLKHGSQ